MLTKKQLEIFVSKLSEFTKPKVKLEQYITPDFISTEWLFNANLLNDIKGKTIADFGAGPGNLGIIALMMGAKKVYFIEIDEEAVWDLEKNLEKLNYDNYEIIIGDVTDFNENVDVTFTNPPFGTRQKGVDKKFILQAQKVSEVVYSMHKTSTLEYIRTQIKEPFKITHEWDYKYPLKKRYEHHKKKVEHINTTILRYIKHSN